MRTQQDVKELFAIVSTMETPAYAMLGGIIFGEYVKHPEAYIWDIVENFFKGKYKPVKIVGLE